MRSPCQRATRCCSTSKRRRALSRSGASISIKPPYVSSPSTLPSMSSRSSLAVVTASVVPSGSLIRMVSGRSLPSSSPLSRGWRFSTIAATSSARSSSTRASAATRVTLTVGGRFEPFGLGLLTRARTSRSAASNEIVVPPLPSTRVRSSWLSASWSARRTSGSVSASSTSVIRRRSCALSIWRRPDNSRLRSSRRRTAASWWSLKNSGSGSSPRWLISRLDASRKS